MRPEMSFNSDPIQKERNRIRLELKELKKKIRELESPHSLSALNAEEFAKREIEIARIQAQIDFLVSGNKQLKDERDKILEQTRVLKKNNLIN